MSTEEQNPEEEKAFNAGREFERNSMLKKLDAEIKSLQTTDWATQDVIGGMIRSIVLIMNSK